MKALAMAAVILAASSVAHADDPRIQFERYKLPNGLEVILAPDQSAPIVAVNVWYHVGSGYEEPGKSGFAHLFEHMMFQGSKNTGKDQHFKTLRAIGSDVINGTTNLDRTNYFEVVPSNQLETALWLESDRMSHLLDLLDAQALSNQIDVVRNERRQNYDNRPYRKALFAQFAALYPEGHPYRYLTIGKHEDLVAASLEDVKNFYRTWYVPANATIALVGDFDVAEAKKAIDKWFGTFPKSTKPAVVAPKTPAQKPAEVAVDDSFAKLRQITFTWHSPGAFKDADAELDIVANVLGADGYGRLYKQLVIDKQLAQSVDASQDGATFSGIFTITVTLRSGADLDAVKQIVLAEVARVGTEPLDAKEIARVVAANEAGAIYRLQNINTRANVLQTYNHFLGDPDRISWDLDRYRKTTPEQIRAAAAQYLVPANAITILTNPVGGAK